jgi:hypothetical protein
MRYVAILISMILLSACQNIQVINPNPNAEVYRSDDPGINAKP